MTLSAQRSHAGPLSLWAIAFSVYTYFSVRLLPKWSWDILYLGYVEESISDT
jgi:hypothetical protein